MPSRVTDVGWDDGRPQVRLKDTAQSYDLLVGATGVNSSGWDLYEKLGFRPKRPQTTKAYITELKLGNKAITQHFGSSMHIFLLNMPRLDCAAIIPKGEHLTVCLLGRDIDGELIDSFFKSPAVGRCFPNTWKAAAGECHCSPKISVHEAARPFLDRVVLVGDCGVTRLYKDGIGAAYRTAKAAARTAVFAGVTARDFQRHYWPSYRTIARDNRFGSFMFGVVHWIKALGPLVRGVVKMTSSEQTHPGAARRMSIVLWDMFTGSASYRDVFMRTLDPRFLGRFGWESALALGRDGRRKGEESGDGTGSAG